MSKGYTRNDESDDIEAQYEAQIQQEEDEWAESEMAHLVREEFFKTHLRNLDTWTLNEAALLVCRYDKLLVLEDKLKRASDLPPAPDETRRCILSAIKSSKLKAVLDQGEYHLDPEQFIEWVLIKAQRFSPITEPHELSTHGRFRKLFDRAHAEKPPKKKRGRPSNPKEKRVGDPIYKAKNEGVSWDNIVERFHSDLNEVARNKRRGSPTANYNSQTLKSEAKRLHNAARMRAERKKT